jgi:hypothetical protein
MKKLIAISVVLALVTGAVFAETSVGGRVQSAASLINVDLNDTDYIGTGGRTGELYMTLNGGSDDGVFTGMLRARYDAGNVDKAYIWWRPIEALGIFMGRDCDSLFETHNIVGWGFAGGDRLGATVEGYRFGNAAWTGGFSSGDYGIAFNITPIEGFAINLGVDYSGTVALQNRFPNYLFGQIKYDISGVGTAAFSYNAGKNDADDEHMAVSFFSDAIVDGLGFELGFGYGLNTEVAYVGLGVHYAGGDFGVKFRAEAVIDEKVDFLADLLPYYNLGIFEARLLIGVEYDGTAEEVGFVINPYLVKDLGAGYLSLGVVYGKGNSDDKGGISLNVGVEFNF